MTNPYIYQPPWFRRQFLTIKDMLDGVADYCRNHPGFENSVIVDAAVNDNPRSIHEGALELELYREDAGNYGTLTIPARQSDITH